MAQHGALGKWHLITAFADQTQGIAVTRQLPLGPSSALWCFAHQRLEPICRRDLALATAG